MTWQRVGGGPRRYISLGDGPGEEPEVKGLLKELSKSPLYDRTDYVFLREDGSEVVVRGSAYLLPRVTQVGAAYHIVFAGRITTGRGKPMKTYSVYMSTDPEIVSRYSAPPAPPAGPGTQADDLPF